MQVKVLGGSSAAMSWARSGCLLVNGTVAFDSGGLASQLTLTEQMAVDHVFVTHAHLDHVGELAFLVDNVMTAKATALKIWGPEPVLDQVRRHLFNNQLWPDFSAIRIGTHPVLEFSPLPTDGPLVVDGLTIRWARTNHPVFSVGYLVEDARGALLYSGDTGPTEAIWEMANRAATLHAVFVEAAFPDQLYSLAIAAGHLTPTLLKQELSKLRRSEAVINVMHVKPFYFEEISRELAGVSRFWQIVSGGEDFLLE